MSHTYKEAVNVFNKAIKEGCRCSIWNNVLHCIRENGTLYEDDQYNWDKFVDEYSSQDMDCDLPEYTSCEEIYVGEDGTRISGYSYEEFDVDDEIGFYQVDGRYNYYGYGVEDDKELIRCPVCHQVYLGEEYDECPICKWKYVFSPRPNKKKDNMVSSFEAKNNLLKGFDALGNPLSWEQKYKYVLNNICKVDYSVIISKFPKLNRNTVSEYKDILRKNPNAPLNAFARIKLDDECLNDEGYKKFIEFMCKYMGLSEGQLIEWCYRLAKYR